MYIQSEIEFDSDFRTYLESNFKKVSRRLLFNIYKNRTGTGEISYIFKYITPKHKLHNR